MSLQRFGDRFRPYSVPVCLFIVVAVAVFLVPPLVLGDASSRTYALTAAVLIVAISSVLPYAVAVGVLTVPFLYSGIGSYAVPAVIPAPEESLTVIAALRHVVAGISYVVAATAVGAVGIGLDFAASSGSTPLPRVGFPPFLALGGAVVAGVFVAVQFWRYDGEIRDLGRRTVFGTAVLGGLLAASPLVALWIFGSFGF